MRKTIFLGLGALLFFVLHLYFPKAYATSLPPCAQWADPHGNKITQQDAINRVDIASKIGASEKQKEDANVKCITVETAIGPINTAKEDFVKSIYATILGIAGGIALLLIMVSGYKFMTSQGNPEAVKGATEQLTSAIIGLLFIIFSFVILQIIGVDILRIPGFEK